MAVVVLVVVLLLLAFASGSKSSSSSNVGLVGLCTKKGSLLVSPSLQLLEAVVAWFTSRGYCDGTQEKEDHSSLVARLWFIIIILLKYIIWNVILVCKNFGIIYILIRYIYICSINTKVSAHSGTTTYLLHFGLSVRRTKKVSYFPSTSAPTYLVVCHF